VNILQRLAQIFIELAKQAVAFPNTIAIALKERRQRSILNELEIERLDRIRNPSKYRGKEI
jgi:hypothetical protein